MAPMKDRPWAKALVETRTKPAWLRPVALGGVEGCEVFDVGGDQSLAWPPLRRGFVRRITREVSGR